MECQKCQSENPEENKFCRECGAMLLSACPQCGAEVFPSDKFCGKCGQKLAESVETRGGVSAVDSERKHVTILFSDLSGYAAMTEKLDPEEVKDIMSRIFGDIAQVVAKYEGFIERFVGDAVMALFGVPKIHEDDAVRAIRAATEIHALVEALSPRLEETVGRPLSMHSGINTGLVVTGEVNLEKGTHGITGDAINLASRIEGLAEAGEILIGEDTFRQAEGYFILERLEPVKVKGKEEPVIAYRVIVPSTRRTRFEVSAQQGLTPLIGRERELEQLLDGFRRAKTGRGQAVSIVSEAGVGKSRLLYEFRKAVAKEDVTFLEGKCLSYGMGVAYHPVIDILKSNFDIMEGDGDQEITEKISGSLKVLGVDEASTLPYLLELLSVKDSSISKIPMSPEAKKNKILEALRRITLKGSEIRPLILVVEDLHWIDKSSEDAIKELLDSISGAKVFLLFTYRPEFVSSWDLKSYHSQVNLNRLSERQALVMIDHLLGSEDIDIDLEQLLLEKTERVPLFLEEFIRSFIDLKFIVKRDKYYLVKDLKDVNIPTTIQDVIMARVDSLSESVKGVIQTGSVIGREFGYELIHKVTGFSEQSLFSHLTALRDSEIVYERGIFPQSTYIFKHALTQDVVYGSILNKRKKKFHEEIGNAIEDLYKENINEYYGVLAEHFIVGESYEKGAEYSKLAGKRAEKTGSLNEAINYAQKRISCLEKMPTNDSIRNKIVHLRTILGLFLIEMNHFAKAKEIIAPIVEMVLKGDDKKRISQILTVIGSIEYIKNEDFPKAFEHLEEALRISKEIEDMMSLSAVSYWIGCAQHLCCEFEKADINIGRAEKITRAANIRWRESTMKSLLSHLVYYYQGRIDLAYETSNEAVRIADESGDIFSKTFAYACHGISCFGKGSFQEAIEFLSIGRESSEKLDQYWWRPWSNHFLGEVYFEIGEYQKAGDHYAKAVSFFDHYGNWPSATIVSKIGLARSETMNNKENLNLEALYGYVSENKAKLYEGWIRRYVAEILLNEDEDITSEAEEWIREAIAADDKNRILFELGRDYLVCAAISRRKGEEAKAIESLKKAVKIFDECGADGWVKKYEKELASVS